MSGMGSRALVVGRFVCVLEMGGGGRGACREFCKDWGGLGRKIAGHCMLYVAI